MDPWLEHPALWPDVHHRLITYACDQLQSRVGANYFVAIDERVYLETPDRSVYPDVTVVEARKSAKPPPISGATAVAADPYLVVRLASRERRESFLEIRDLRAGKRVVTVIEILSPTNKRPGKDQDLYRQKQSELLASNANLVEIDLLRGGSDTVAHSIKPKAPYCVVVSRATARDQVEVYPVSLRERLPRVAVPLAAPDPDVVLDLPAAFAETYDKGAFARRVDYRDAPEPPLVAEDLVWARERVAETSRG